MAVVLRYRRLRRVALVLAALVAGLFVVTAAVPSARGAASSGWNIVNSPSTGSNQSDVLMGTTCTSAWNCLAVGGAFSSLGNGQPNALVDTWNGSTWSVGPNVVPPGSQASLLWGVDCVTSSDCWAVGGEQTPATTSPVIMAEMWNGSVWTVVPTPAVDGYLFSVTCTSSSDCWAVGQSVDGKQNSLSGVIIHWDGSQWSQSTPASSGQPHDGFNSIACTTSSDCWAVGYAGPNSIQYNLLPGVAPNLVDGAALTEHWNGSAWSVVPTPGAAAPAGQLLNSVTCTSTSNCWAVGATMDGSGNPSTTLVDRWNGSSWMTVPSAEPPTPANNLNVVTCVNASDCWATGATDDGGQNTSPTPFFENWNGSAWTVEPSPTVTAFGYLSGLACVRSTGCFAVGFAATNLNNGTLETLIEQLALPPAGNQGLWMSGSDGGVFALGTAGFYGSTGGIHLNKPVVGMAPAPDGGGYWLVASDGGVFAFGDADFYGSVPGQGIVQHAAIEGMVATPDGRGYWIVGSDGALYTYGDASFLGSLVGLGLAAPVAGAAAG